ncbi:ATPase AAA [Spirochaetia bacterium]|nr:ATPase AAA [Spirochaetia bacterium]
MLKRKIIDDLVLWKNRTAKMPLLITGARQIGKTFAITAFANANYEHRFFLNFDEKPNYKTIFEGNLDVDTLVKQMSLVIPNAVFVPGKTIIFFDEIQNCPAARTALKFFSIDKRFDVIATGSLLGIHYKGVPSFPVGYVEYLDMYSLDFEEFLWASGVSPQSITGVKEFFEKKESVPKAMHEKMLALLKEYIVVGGMPRVVCEFIETKNFASVLKLQRGIIRDYTDDIIKYADGAERTKARECFLSIPKQLAKDYKKFQFSVVEKKAASRKYGGSLLWLYDAGIINFCYNLRSPELPLEGNAINDAFKVYMRDTGLLMAMLEDGSGKDIIDGNLGIYKGAIYENIIADIFGKSGKKLFYFEYRSQIEVDFFLRQDDIAVAVEVKSAENTKSKSMQNIIANYGVPRGIKLSTKNITTSAKVDSYPLYMAMFL